MLIPRLWEIFLKFQKNGRDWVQSHIKGKIPLTYCTLGSAKFSINNMRRLFRIQYTSLSAGPNFSFFFTVYVLTLSYATCFACFSRLRAELAVLRRRGAVRVGGDAPADPGRACGRCRAELGRIINRGAVCRSASFFSSHNHQFLLNVKSDDFLWVP